MAATIEIQWLQLEDSLCLSKGQAAIAADIDDRGRLTKFLGLSSSCIGSQLLADECSVLGRWGQGQIFSLAWMGFVVAIVCGGDRKLGEAGVYSSCFSIASINASKSESW